MNAKYISIKEQNIFVLKHFVNFLKENNALESYLFNIKKESNRYRLSRVFKVLFAKNAIEKIEFLTNAPYLIGNAFCWVESRKGIYYWENLSMKWVDYLNELKVKHKFIVV
jgi:hypothetical protein